MSDDLQCPYCGTYREQPDETNESGVVHEAQCGNCEKTFGFTVDWYPSFDELKLPCANGEPHNWEKINSNHEYWENRRRCSYCDEEKTLERIEKEKENG